MKTGDWLRIATQFLQSRGITTARLDCQILLEDTTRKDRVWLLAHPEYELSDAALEHLKNLLGRRAKHEPLAYLRGRSEFYGRTFVINKAVLVPRPESETMIDLLKELSVFSSTGHEQLSQDEVGTTGAQNTPKQLTIADIGTGSGALGITAKLELPTCQIDLIELDEHAIKTAQLNVDKFATRVRVIHSDLLSDTTEDYDILLCNLPYVPDEYEINKAATHEPKIALFSGADGLDLYRKLFDQLQNMQNQPLYILTESLLDQHAALSDIAVRKGYTQTKTRGLVQLFEPIA